jgi:membrane protein
MSIMEEIFGREHYGGLWRLVASLVFSVLLLATIYLSIAVVLTGNWFFHMLEGLLNIDIFVGAWPWMRFLILLGLVFLFILLIYKVTLPPGRPHPPLFPGAILADVILVAASMLFSWFMGISTRYSLIYGSLASVMILLVWLYLCGNIIIMGTVFNYVLFQRDLWAPNKKRLRHNKNTTGG